MPLDGQVPEPVLSPDADQAAFDAPPVHFVQRVRNRVVGIDVLLGHLLEHVLGGEGELLFRLPILRLPGDEGIRLLHVPRSEADHGVDGSDAGWHGHQVGPFAECDDLTPGGAAKGLSRYPA